MKYILVLLLSVTLGLTSCDFFGSSNSGKNSDANEVNADGIFYRKQHYYNDPSAPVEWKVSLKKNEDGETVRQGVSIRYSKSGKVYEEVNYENNLKQGTRLTYHGNGKVWKEQVYNNGKLDGICKRYDREGRITAEYPYKNGYPGIGLKEYTNLGVEREMPKLHIQKIDQVRTANKYKLKLSLTGENLNRIKSVKYYNGDLIEGKYFHKNMIEAKPTSAKTGELSFGVPNGYVLNKTFNVVAVAITTDGLKLILQDKVSISVRGV